MGLFSNVLGGQKDRDQQGPVESMHMPPGMEGGYGAYAQGIDPGTMQMLNAPNQGGNAQIAQYAIDNDELIETITADLRGYRVMRRLNMESRQYEDYKEEFGTSVMNENGVNATRQILRLFLSKPNALSNFPEEDRARVDMAMMILWKKLAGMYATNASRYELDRSRRSPIAYSIVWTVYMNTMRSYQDGERPRMYGSHKTIQSIQGFSGPPAQPKKFMGIFG